MATQYVITAGKDDGNPADFPSKQPIRLIYQLMAFGLQGYHSDNSPGD